MPLVSSGVENGNLRELAMGRMKDFGAECRDVRAREVGVHEIHNKVRPDEVELIRRDYTANGGESHITCVSSVSHADLVCCRLGDLLVVRRSGKRHPSRSPSTTEVLRHDFPA